MLSLIQDSFVLLLAKNTMLSSQMVLDGSDKIRCFANQFLYIRRGKAYKIFIVAVCSQFQQVLICATQFPIQKILSNELLIKQVFRPTMRLGIQAETA